MIDLHLHLDGSLSAETIIKLAKQQGVELPTYNAKELEKKIFKCSKKL
jgi:adenosine deaminase